jgi:SAM-dependent methyltransferase
MRTGATSRLTISADAVREMLRLARIGRPSCDFAAWRSSWRSSRQVWMQGGTVELRGYLVSADGACHKACVSSTEDEYWNHFYSHRQMEIETPSSFALHVVTQLRDGAQLFELGCGNGRDALFFAHRGLAVIACDRSQVAVESLQARPDLDRFVYRPRFLVADFLELDRAYAGPAPEVVYSRFTLHAVPAHVQTAALDWTRRMLRPGGTLYIEVRSVKGSLYGKGEPVERDAFVHDNHYRRFLRLEELTAQLLGLGFLIDSATESDGVAVYRDDDPVVIRIAASLPR